MHLMLVIHTSADRTTIDESMQADFEDASAATFVSAIPNEKQTLSVLNERTDLQNFICFAFMLVLSVITTLSPKSGDTNRWTNKRLL